MLLLRKEREGASTPRAREVRVQTPCARGARPYPVRERCASIPRAREVRVHTPHFAAKFHKIKSYYINHEISLNDWRLVQHPVMLCIFSYFLRKNDTKYLLNELRTLVSIYSLLVFDYDYKYKKQKCPEVTDDMYLFLLFDNSTKTWFNFRW